MSSLAQADSRVAVVVDPEGKLPFVRTRECAPRQTNARKDFWEIARAPKLSAYCDRLAQAEALLELSPQEAHDAASKADELLPGRAAPLVLQGRALTALNRPSDAVAVLKKAKEIEPLSLEHAPTLYAFALALRDTQDKAGAAEAFRSLATRVSLLPAALRSQAMFDAAAQIMVLGGNDAADEAIAILRSASQSAPQSFRPLIEAYLALALDRRGSKIEAETVAMSAWRGGVITGWLMGAHPELLRAMPEERAAVTARMREVNEPANAVALWESAASAQPSGAWAAHARSKAADLKKNAGPVKPARPARR